MFNHEKLDTEDCMGLEIKRLTKALKIAFENCDTKVAGNSLCFSCGWNSALNAYERYLSESGDTILDGMKQIDDELRERGEID